MTKRHLLTGLTLMVLVGLLIVGGVMGWRYLLAPLPETEAQAPTSDPSSCVGEVGKGDTVRSKDVTVSIYNAGSRAGLASRTQDELAARGFIRGEVGNAPEDLGSVRFVRVLTTTKKDPAAKLVALQFGKNTLVQVKPNLGPGIEVVLGDRFKGLKKAPRTIKAKAPVSGC